MLCSIIFALSSTSTSSLMVSDSYLKITNSLTSLAYSWPGLLPLSKFGVSTTIDYFSLSNIILAASSCCFSFLSNAFWRRDPGTAEAICCFYLSTKSVLMKQFSYRGRFLSIIAGFLLYSCITSSRDGSASSSWRLKSISSLCFTEFPEFDAPILSLAWASF